MTTRSAPQAVARTGSITCGGAIDSQTGHYVDSLIVYATAVA